MATANYDLWQAYKAGPVIWGALQDTTVLGFVYQAGPFLTKNEPAQANAYRYDQLGRLVEIALNPQGTAVIYDFDASGNRKSVTTVQGLGGL